MSNKYPALAIISTPNTDYTEGPPKLTSYLPHERYSSVNVHVRRAHSLFSSDPTVLRVSRYGLTGLPSLPAVSRVVENMVYQVRWMDGGCRGN